ncbi:MAG: alpha/beta fold hydrolase [Gemmatimonadales bacterium]
MSQPTPVTVTVYAYECDAYGHLNEAAFLQVFERARWETIARGPGMDLFRRQGVWPAVRKASVEYHRPAFPGDVLEISTELVKLGRTSMELRHRALRPADGQLIAEAQLLFVIVDSSGNPTPVPDELATLFGVSASTRSGEVVRYDVNGVSLAVDVRGDGPGLLFLHGFPFNRTIWKHQLSALSGWRRIAPDLRGFGESDAPEGGYSMATYADDCAMLLDRLRLGKAVVVGLSMGGYIAFELLRRHPDRVAGLILCDTKAEPDSAEGAKGRDETATIARTKGSAAIADRMIPVVLGRTTLQTQPQLVQQVREMITRTPVAGIVGALEAMKTRADSSDLLRGITVPTLVVVGQEDAMGTPAQARAMASAIPSATMTTIEGAGHVPPLEAPTAVSRVFSEFLEAVRDG